VIQDKLRAVSSFPVMLGSVLVLCVYLLCGGSVADPDLWWHLRNADYLWTQGKLPAFDMFSYTALGHPWMNHEWLAEIPFYLGWRVGGLVGIFVVYTLVLEIILLGVFYLAWKASDNVKGAFLASCLGVALAVVGFGPRTILFGYLYLLILVFLLWRFRTEGRAPLWALPLLFCLWINTHGSWLLGMIVFGTFVVTGLWEGQWGRIEAERWSPQQLKRLLLTGGASLAALFVNPFTYRLVFYPFDLAFRQKLNISHVEEWTSVNFHEARGKVVLILLVALLLGALLNRRRWKLPELALGLFALYSGLTYARFLFLAAILVTPLLAKMLDFLPPYRPEIDKRVLNALIIAGILVCIVLRFPSQNHLNDDVAGKYPVNALAIMKVKGIQGPIFNWYGWGGYIAWRHPEIKTFIDGRADIFEYTGVFKDYLDVMGIKNSLQILEKRGVRTVMFPPDQPLSYLLTQSAEWKTVYSDKVCLVLTRAAPNAAALPPPAP
jgi:hypothetical protein